jgi:tRNA threonylcarbamoyladenosine biosynthesis protein TsaB
MNTLYVDTRDSKATIVILKTDNREFKVKSKRKNPGQVTLSLIEKVLKRAGIKIDKIDKIEVERGPGSFTGIRVGVSIANAISLSLLKRINKKKLGTIETPKY